MAFNRKLWMKEYSKRYREENRERRIIADRIRYYANREENNEASKQWRKRNPERVKTYNQEYARKRAEDNRKRAEEWAKQHPERAKANKKLSYLKHKDGDFQSQLNAIKKIGKEIKEETK